MGSITSAALSQVHAIVPPGIRSEQQVARSKGKRDSGNRLLHSSMWPAEQHQTLLPAHSFRLDQKVGRLLNLKIEEAWQCSKETLSVTTFNLPSNTQPTGLGALRMIHHAHVCC